MNDKNFKEEDRLGVMIKAEETRKGISTNDS